MAAESSRRQEVGGEGIGTLVHEAPLVRCKGHQHCWWPGSSETATRRLHWPLGLAALNMRQCLPGPEGRRRHRYGRCRPLVERGSDTPGSGYARTRAQRYHGGRARSMLRLGGGDRACLFGEAVAHPCVSPPVMAGLDPAIPVFHADAEHGVDPRAEPGDDGGGRMGARPDQGRPERARAALLLLLDEVAVGVEALDLGLLAQRPGSGPAAPCGRDRSRPAPSSPRRSAPAWCASPRP